MRDGWSIAVSIPAHNESNFIQGVLETLPDYVDLAVVVDDGSTDGTGDIARQANASCKVEVIRLEKEGVGAAIDAGHKRIMQVLQEPFISIVMAGDGQMDPSDIPALCQPIISGNADYVKGNRKMHPDGLSAMPKTRRRATKILEFFTTLAMARIIGDPQCGYTATSYQVLKSWNWQRSWKGYGYPNYWLINLSRYAWRVEEVPVRAIYGDEKSGIKNTSFFLKVGMMMSIEHHKRALSWLFKPRNRGAMISTQMSFIAYLLGWLGLILIPGNFTDDLMADLILAIFNTAILWTGAAFFDRETLSIILRDRIESQAGN